MYPQDQNQTRAPVLANSSSDEYLRALRLFADGGERWIENIGSKSRARGVAAAVRWCIAQVECGNIANDQLSGEPSELLTRLGGRDRALEIVNRIEIHSLKRREGRVRKLLGLDRHWATRLVAATETENVLEHAAVVALFLTGCRLSELSDMALHLNGDNLSVVIHGRKVRNDAGQEFRGVILPSEGVVIKLTSLCPKDGSIVEPFKTLSPRRVERVIEKASQETQGAPRRVSSSCLRNHVSSLCKALGWSPSKIAMMLGHQSEATQKYYGRSILGSNPAGWVKPIKVMATTPTRPAGPKPFRSAYGESNRERQS